MTALHGYIAVRGIDRGLVRRKMELVDFNDKIPLFQCFQSLRIKIGTASEEADLRTMEVKGRNIITGLPKVVTLTSEEIRTALRECTGQIVEAVHGVLEKTPPELAADIMDRGIVLTGGGAMLHGMDALIEQKTGVSTLTVQDAMLVVAAGTGKYAEIMSRM